MMALQKKLKRKGQKTEGRKKHNVTKTQPQRKSKKYCHSYEGRV